MDGTPKEIAKTRKSESTKQAIPLGCESVAGRLYSSPEFRVFVPSRFRDTPMICRVGGQGGGGQGGGGPISSLASLRHSASVIRLARQKPPNGPKNCIDARKPKFYTDVHTSGCAAQPPFSGNLRPPSPRAPRVNAGPPIHLLFRIPFSCLTFSCPLLPSHRNWKKNARR